MDRLEALYSALENEADTQRQQRDGDRQARAALELENARLRESLTRLEQQASLAGEADAELAALRSERASLSEQLSGARQQLQQQQSQLSGLHESLLARDAELKELGEQLRDALQAAQHAAQAASLHAQAESDRRSQADAEAATEQLAADQVPASLLASRMVEAAPMPMSDEMPREVVEANEIAHAVEDSASVVDSSPSIAQPSTTQSSDAPTTSAQPSPQALLKQWYRRYPDTFFKGHTRPLKIGIHIELLENEQWDDKLVRRALAGYVHLPRYLKAVRAGTQRVDLEGQSVGAVTEDEALHARQQLDELTRQQKAREEQAADQRISHKLSELMAKNRP